MGRTATRAMLLVLQGFVAITAIAGAVLVVPTLPLDWIRHGPMRDFTIPAVTLGLVVGGSAIVALALLVVDSPRAGVASMVAGALMVAFEFVEITVVGFSLLEFGAGQIQSWLQIVYIAFGVAGIALGHHLWQLKPIPRAWRYVA
jgi:hypothetical protein